MADRDLIAAAQRFASLLVGVTTELGAPGDTPFDDLPRLVREFRANATELRADLLERVGHAEALANGLRARIAELEQQATDRTLMDPKQFDAMLAALDTPNAAPRLAAVVAGPSLGYLPVMEWHDGWAIRGPVADRATAEEITARDAAAAPGFRHVVAELREVSAR